MSNGATQQPIGEEVRAAARGVVEQVLVAMAGRAYSPRIKLLDIHQVTEATGLSETTIRREMGSGRFPLPQKNLGKNMWRESAIIAWADRNDPNLSKAG